jgi:copper chaperone CopZ
MISLQFSKKYGLSLLIVIFGLLSSANVVSAQETSSYTYIKIQVDGLSCPFCAYGLEKNLKKVKGASELFISIVNGYTTFQVSKEKLPTENELTKIVEDAGFTARKITFSEKSFAKEEDDDR